MVMKWSIVAFLSLLTLATYFFFPLSPARERATQTLPPHAAPPPIAREMGKAAVVSVSTPLLKDDATWDREPSPGDNHAKKLSEEVDFLKKQLEEAVRENSAAAARVKELEDREASGPKQPLQPADATAPTQGPGTRPGVMATGAPAGAGAVPENGASFRAEREKLEGERDALKKERDALLAERDETSSANRDLRQRLDDLEKSGNMEREQFTTRVALLEARLNDSSGSGESAHSKDEEGAALREEMRKSKEERDTLQKERDSLLAEKNEALSANRDLQQRLDDLEKSENTEREGLNNRIAALEARLNRTTDSSGSSSPKKDDGQLVREVVEVIQQTLLRLGYESGEVDGIVGPRTKKAILSFQADLGIQDSEPVPELQSLLGRYEQVQALQPDWAEVMRGKNFRSWLEHLPDTKAFQYHEVLKSGSARAIHTILARFKAETR